MWDTFIWHAQTGGVSHRIFPIIPVRVKSDEDDQIIWEESYQIVKQNLFVTSDNNNTEGNGKGFKM